MVNMDVVPQKAGVITTRNFAALFKIAKQLIEKSRDCHNHKPQPTPDTKRKRKMTKTNTYKTTKQTNAGEAHRPTPSSPIEVITMLKRMKKHEDKEHGKTPKHEASVAQTTKPHRIRTTPGPPP